VNDRAKGYIPKGDCVIAVFMELQCNLYKLGGLVIDVAKALEVSEVCIDMTCIDMLSSEQMMEVLSGISIFIDNSALFFELKHRAILQLIDLEEDIINSKIADKANL
jgi:hypothetical protein